VSIGTEVTPEQVAEVLRKQGVRMRGVLVGDGTPVSPLEAAAPNRRLIDGATFALDPGAEQPAVWGRGQEILWAAGEPLLVNGPTGIGKTTVMQALALAVAGIRPGGVLGFPIAPVVGRVLYVAADRPVQARRSLARMVTEADREALRDRVRVWRGPLDFDIARDPERLLALARSAEASAVFIDSLKDVARELSKDETGSGIQRAYGLLTVEGIELAIAHHGRKSSAENGKPKQLDDVYGSAFITAGAGSVVLSWGKPGDPVVELGHLKPPAEAVGPLVVTIDHETGSLEVADGGDPLSILRGSPAGLSAGDLARALFGTPTPTKAEEHRARRKLERWCREGFAHRREEQAARGAIKSPDRYFAVSERDGMETLE
jgi:replicative DNA helicase